MTGLGKLIAAIVGGVQATRDFKLVQVLLRLAILVAGAAAILVEGSAGGGAGLVTVIAACAIAYTAIGPDSYAPLTAILALGVGWLIEIDDRDQPVQLVVMAVLLYLVHTLAALAAAMPITAEVDRDVLPRWSWHLIPVVIGTAAVAAVASAVSGIDGSQGLVVLGLLGALACLIAPIALYQSRR
jgi:hypothetical protein